MAPAKYGICSPRTPVQIMTAMIREGTLEVASARESLLNIWMNMGVVSALILTMIRYTHDWGCTEDLISTLHHEQFCRSIHPGLSTVALACSLLSTMLSALLNSYLTLVPEDHVADFLDSFGHLGNQTMFAFLGSVALWVADTTWVGCNVYGFNTPIIMGGAVLIGIMAYIIVVMGRMRRFLGAELGEVEEGDSLTITTAGSGQEQD